MTHKQYMVFIQEVVLWIYGYIQGRSQHVSKNAPAYNLPHLIEDIPLSILQVKATL